jgi:hypothetical protein
MGTRALKLEQCLPRLHRGNRRKSGRLRVAEVQCSLGEVMDLAATGMRVRGRGRPGVRTGQVCSMTLATPLGLLSARAEVVWVRREGFWHHELGLTFVEMSEDVRAGLASVAAGYADGGGGR